MQVNVLMCWVFVLEHKRRRDGVRNMRNIVLLSSTHCFEMSVKVLT